MYFIFKLQIWRDRKQKKEEENFRAKKLKVIFLIWCVNQWPNIRFILRIRVQLKSSKRFKLISKVNEFWQNLTSTNHYFNSYISYKDIEEQLLMYNPVSLNLQ